MRVLMLLSRVPYPLEKGDKLRAFHQIKELSKKHEIILCCLSDEAVHPDAEKILRPFVSHLYIIKLSKQTIFISLLKSIFTNKPFQVSYFYQKKAQKIIQKVIEEHIPKHIFCQLIRVTEYVKKYNYIDKTLDYMDCLSIGMKRRMKHTFLLLKPIVWIEYLRLKKYEAAIFTSFKNKLIISEQDKTLIDHPFKSEIQVISNGVDDTYFNADLFKNQTKEFDLVFTGNLSYPPNVECVFYLVKKIVPLLEKEFPKLRVLICGANPLNSIKALASKRIIVTGWVDDIRDAYAQSRIFVAPLTIGSGLQNKLLEAMMMKLPCVTSHLANGALKAKENEEILIGENPADFAKKISLLMHDEALRTQLATKGHAYVLKTYSWKTSVEELNQLIIQA